MTKTETEEKTDTNSRVDIVPTQNLSKRRRGIRRSRRWRRTSSGIDPYTGFVDKLTQSLARNKTTHS